MAEVNPEAKLRTFGYNTRMLSVRNLYFSHNTHIIFEDAEFSVSDGQKVGLIGPNGAGKSTLFKIISGEEKGYKGKIETTGSIGVVPQEVKHDPVMESASSIRDYLNPENDKQEYQLLKNDGRGRTGRA